MPEDGIDTPSAPSAPQPSESPLARPSTARLEQAMNLAGLLEALSSAAGDAVQDDSSSTAPLGQPAADALPEALVAVIRKELGDPMGDVALRSLGGKPLSRDTAKRILQAAMKLAAARQAAALSAGRPPALEDPRGDSRGSDPVQDDDPAQGTTSLERRAQAHWLERLARRPIQEAAHRSPVSSLEDRHAALLADCLELVRESRVETSGPEALGEAAKRLHDRVREFLEKRGRWPLSGADDYEEHAKPIAVVLAAWDAADP
jgi:hypothetical protein